MRILGNPLIWLVGLMVLMPAHGYYATQQPWIVFTVDGSNLFSIAFAYTAACWVGRDAVRRRNHFPPDLIFFMSVILLPVYVIMTRKWRGVLFLMGWLGGLVASEWLTYLATV